MEIYDITSSKFRPYGSIIRHYDFSELLNKMRTYPIPEELDYVASDPSLEELPIFRTFQQGFFGGLPVALGYCMGHNQALNALEYHRTSEVNVAVTDYIVMLGRQQDVQDDYTYDTSLVESFYVPAGLAVEFYATTLHYCACHVQEKGYCHATFLPRGTNCELDEMKTDVVSEHAGNIENKLLTAKNKWLLVHEESSLASRLPIKLVGQNWKIDERQWNARNK
ncbi:MAG: DUF4867 family protein [Lachnospiraceae bacterium]